MSLSFLQQAMFVVAKAQVGESANDIQNADIGVGIVHEEFLREFHAAKPDQRDAVAQKYGLTFFAGRPV
jgi:hypothetical protein